MEMLQSSKRQKPGEKLPQRKEQPELLMHLMHKELQVCLMT
jgi:hypothetical protein